MTKTGKQNFTSRVILFRSGGIGDILLTFPLLEILVKKFDELMVCMPSKYHFLIREISPKANLYDLDRGDKEVIKLAKGALVISFWNDPKWTREWQSAGASQVRSFDPRPVTGEHFAKSLLEKFASPTNRKELNRTWLSHGINSTKASANNLWIHAGSGSVSKNLPFLEFIFFAEHWLEKNPAAMLFFSFGEADLKLVEEFSQHPISKRENVKYKIFSSLKDFHSNLRMHSGSFAGNDSGPSHMAAMLGLETHVWFRNTNAEIWAPLGPAVKIYQSESVPSKIL